MKTKYGKPIEPKRFQANIIADTKGWAQRMKERAEEYGIRAEEYVSACPVCKSKQYISLVTVYGFDYVQCKKCAHVFSTKRLSQEQLNTFYRDSAEYAKQYTSEDQLAYRMRHISGPKIKYAMSFVPKVKKGTWLDVGSAVGDVLRCVESYRGWKAIGLEASALSVKTGREVLKVDVRQELFQDFVRKNKNEKFDVISFFGYLELITDPLKELRLAQGLLKKNGVLVIGEANGNSFSTLLQKSFPEYSMRHLLPPPVIQQFTKQSACVALQKAGFTPSAFWNFGMDFYEFTKYLVLLIPRFQETSVYSFLMDHTNEFQSVIDQEEYGDCFMMIAKRS
ncbi:MAG: class I SAM-dependent methyltransferase [Patescibacteria group bacterium]|nr:class I SAM-dependent methyltransferase [Patescibacteria group bacterium]MDE2438445.1 class I SAM-dependent methyltransferase [Patescibacteria group bacterium]